MHFTFNYYKERCFVNNVMCGWNLFLVLLTNNPSSVNIEYPKVEEDMTKPITCTRKKKYFNKKKVILSRT